MGFQIATLNLKPPYTKIIHPCSSHIRQELMLPGAVGLDVLLNSSLQVILTVPEVEYIESKITYILSQAAS